MKEGSNIKSKIEMSNRITQTSEEILIYQNSKH